MQTRARVLGGLTASFLFTCLGPAAANDRHFTYTYETAVLAHGERELELWTTWRTGRERYYSAFDHRIELEIGLGHDLMTALYLNARATTAQNELDQNESSFEYKGVSSEWKYKLSDPVADPIGSGFYAEVTLSPNEYELELKVLLDKRVGAFSFAFNAVGEIEWELEDEGSEWEREYVLAPTLGVAYFVTERFSLGLELRNHNEVEGGEWKHSALHGGPVLAYSDRGWWMAVTFLPQITSFKGGSGRANLVLDDHERFESRLLLGTHL